MDPSWLSFQNFQKSVAPESWEQTKFFFFFFFHKFKSFFLFLFENKIINKNKRKESLTMLKKNWTQYSNASMLELFLMAEEYDVSFFSLFFIQKKKKNSKF